MLFSGQDRVTPANGMWPLVCNEVGLSYEQEERVRNFQRILLTNRQSWLERHTAAATENVIHTLLTSIHKVGHVVRETDRSALNVLSLEQRVAFSAWASRRSESIARVAASKGIAFGNAKVPVDMSMGAMGVELSRENHEAVNLYLLDHKLRTLCETLPPVPSLVPSDLLKGLSQRPLFESLASTTAALEEKQGGNKLSRERSLSLSSNTSLKRSAGDLSQLDEPPTPVVPNVTPQVAEDVAAPFVQEVLGSVASLIPPRAIGNPEMISLNPPVLRNASHSKSTEDYPPMPVPSAMLSSTSSLDLYQVSENSQSHQSGMSDSTKGHVSFSDDLPERYGGNGPSGEQDKGYQSWTMVQDSMQRSRSCPTIQSVLPSHMNIVPEDGYLGSISYVNVDTDGAEDFLFDLAEEDWAIGEGLDMDIT